MADDVTMYNRQPWARRSWTTLIEVVRHFGVLEEQKKTLEREARQFERNAAKRSAPPTKKNGIPPAGPISALPVPAVESPPPAKEKKKRKTKTEKAAAAALLAADPLAVQVAPAPVKPAAGKPAAGKPIVKVPPLSLGPASGARSPPPAKVIAN